MFPGPLIEANTGDQIVVKVTNNMVNGTAIHWHGMYQNGKLCSFSFLFPSPLRGTSRFRIIT
jgi:FtsP/CotA-like multicopper oxidase with cupredoxin domain